MEHCGASVSKQSSMALNYVAKALPVKYQITTHRLAGCQSVQKCYVRMWPTAIALNYSVDNIWNDICQKIIGASMSEPHTSLFNCNFSYIIIIWRTSFHISLML